MTCKWQNQKMSLGSAISHPAPHALLRACQELGYNHLHAFFKCQNTQLTLQGRKK